MEQPILVSDLTLHRNVIKEVMVHEKNQIRIVLCKTLYQTNPLYHHVILLI